MSINHLLTLLSVVVLIFGTKKLCAVGSDLGGAVRDFRQSVNSQDSVATNATLPHTEATVIAESEPYRDAP